MFLYTPKTDEQKEELILAYQLIINNFISGFINLLFSTRHYRFYFIQCHKNNVLWNRLLNWADNLNDETTRERMLIFTVIFWVFLYFALCWIYYAFKLVINYKKIRHEAPLNILKLG